MNAKLNHIINDLAIKGMILHPHFRVPIITIWLICVISDGRMNRENRWLTSFSCFFLTEAKVHYQHSKKWESQRGGGPYFALLGEKTCGL